MKRGQCWRAVRASIYDVTVAARMNGGAAARRYFSIFFYKLWLFYSEDTSEICQNILHDMRQRQWTRKVMTLNSGKDVNNWSFSSLRRGVGVYFVFTL